MAKRKVRKFSEGGDYESSDDAKNLIAAAAREKADYEASQSKMPEVGSPLKMASFGEAFKEARSRGDKTFEYMGKKYSTDMAKPRAAAAAPAPKVEVEEKPKAKSFAEKQEAAGEKMRGAYRGAADNIKKGVKSLFGMKKGGSVKSASARADGCAQRGKTRGKMV